MRNQRQLALDLRTHRRGHAQRVTPGRALPGKPGQRLAGRHASGHGLARVAIFDFVEAEGAALRYLQRGSQQVGRVDAGQAHALAQVALGMRLQRKAAFGHGPAQAHRCEHVLQRLARAHMHVHIARRHQRQTGGGAHALQGGKPQVVVGAQQQFGHQPEVLLKDASCV